MILVLLVVIIEQITSKYSGLHNYFMVLWILWVWDSGRAWLVLLLLVMSQWYPAGEWANQQGPRKLCSRVICLGRGRPEVWA